MTGWEERREQILLFHPCLFSLLPACCLPYVVKILRTYVNHSSSLVKASDRIEWHQSRTQSPLTSYGAFSTKTKALERTGSESPQIADLLYCITFQITNQDCLRTGPFQNLLFRRACAVRSQQALGTRLEWHSSQCCIFKSSKSRPLYWLPYAEHGRLLCYLLAVDLPTNQPTNQCKPT